MLGYINRPLQVTFTHILEHYLNFILIIILIHVRMVSLIYYEISFHRAVLTLLHCTLLCIIYKTGFSIPFLASFSSKRDPYFVLFVVVTMLRVFFTVQDRFE